MTRIILRQMLERKKGAIINISSLSGVVPAPLLTVYSCTKVAYYFSSHSLKLVNFLVCIEYMTDYCDQWSRIIDVSQLEMFTVNQLSAKCLVNQLVNYLTETENGSQIDGLL